MTITFADGMESVYLSVLYLSIYLSRGEGVKNDCKVFSLSKQYDEVVFTEVGKNEDGAELAGRGWSGFGHVKFGHWQLSRDVKWAVSYRGLELMGPVGVEGHFGNDQCRMMIFRTTGLEELT